MQVLKLNEKDKLSWQTYRRVFNTSISIAKHLDFYGKAGLMETLMTKVKVGQNTAICWRLPAREGNYPDLLTVSVTFSIISYISQRSLPLFYSCQFD